MKSVNEGENKWCVPDVLSILTGKSTDECARVISQVSGNPNVTFVDFEDTKQALAKLRFRMEEVPVRGYSLFGCLTDLSTKPSSMYIVGVPKHLTCVEVVSNKEIYFCDNHTKTPINAAGSARLGQRVNKIWRVFPKEEPELVDSGVKVAEVINPNGQVSVSAIYKETYTDQDDDITRLIGSLKFKNVKEMLEFAKELNKLVLDKAVEYRIK